MFFLIVNCLSACFDGISALSVGGGCHSKPARGTKNFDKVTNSSGNRRIFASMLKMHLTGTSLCRCCLETDEIPSAPNSLYHVSQVKEAGFAHQVAIKYSIEPNAPLRNSSGFLTSLLFICLSKNESIASLNLRTVSFP